MKAKEKIFDRLNKVIRTGQDAINSSGFNSYFVDEGQYYAFKAHGLACLTDILGESHSYTKSFQKIFFEKGRRSEVEGAHRLLMTVRQELELDHLHSIKELIHAELFSDFIEMAEHLSGEGYKDPAAVLAGAVLEQHLRKLCIINDISTSFIDPKGKTKQRKASELNDELGKKEVYSAIQKKIITSWQGIRNNAAHGNFEGYTKDQVNSMINDLQIFIANFPA